MADIKFTGNLGQDAELRFTPAGRAVLNFSVADSKSKPDGNGGWDKVAEQWLACAIWGELAEFYHDKLTKGARVTVYGEFFARKYEAKDGTPGTSLDVNVKGVDILPAKNGGTGRPQGGSQQKDDPWAASPASSNAGDWGNGAENAPPF